MEEYISSAPKLATPQKKQTKICFSKKSEEQTPNQQVLEPTTSIKETPVLSSTNLPSASTSFTDKNYYDRQLRNSVCLKFIRYILPNEPLVCILANLIF